MLRRLADAVVHVRPALRATVAIDGVDGVGKTVLADELAELLRHRRPVVRVSIDGFHRPRALRYARGTGPDTFYADSYDYPAFRQRVTEPFRAGRPVTPAAFDVVTDEPVCPAPVEVEQDALLVVDGIFLQRPELADLWDAVVFVDAPFAVTVPRGNARFAGDHDPRPEAAANRRYVEGQRLYLAQARPRERADWVFDNTDLDRPRVTGVGVVDPLSRPGSGGGSRGAR